MVLISALAIGLTAFLNLGKFERTFSELESSRVRFAVSDLRANLETGLSLGLPLKSLANAQAMIEFETQKDPDIISISVYDETGATVFHTGQALGSETVPESWRLAANAKNDRNWQLTESGSLVVGTALSSIIGSQAGGLALRYSRRAHDGMVDSVANTLKLASIVAVGAAASIAIFGINLLLARTNRKLKRIESFLEREHSEGLEAGDRKSDPETSALVDGVIDASRAAIQDLEDLEDPASVQQPLRTSDTGQPEARS
jgi:hypothetical protein